MVEVISICHIGAKQKINGLYVNRLFLQHKLMPGSRATIMRCGHALGNEACENQNSFSFT